MAQFPMFPLWTDAYLADTTHLSTVEHGAYLLLLITMWRSGDKALPNDDVRLARFARLRLDQWRRMKPTILAFFEIDGGCIRQARLTDEAESCARFSESQGRKAKARWLKKRHPHDAAAMPERCHLPTPLVNSESHTNVVALSQPSLLDTQGGVGGVPTGPPDSRNGNGSLSHQPTKKQRGTRLPEDWALNDDGRSWCREVLGFSDPVINETEDEFRDWALSASGPHTVKLNWNRAFKNWARRKHERLRAETRREQQWRERFQTSRR